MNGNVDRLDTTEIFPKNVIEQAVAASKIRISNYLARRLDLRSKTVFTFGDTPDAIPCSAFSIYPNGTGWQLGVHVADISEFIPEGSPIDAEARRRLASHTNGFVKTQMLPEKLRDTCCLKVGEDRLSLSVLLDINSNGTLNSISFEESIVRVAQHCVYSEVDQYAITSDTSSVFALREKYAPIHKKLEALYSIAAMFYANRIANGGIDLTVFRKFYKRNEEGRIIDIRQESEPDLRAMVREIGYFVSKSLGEYLYKKNIPAIFVGLDSVPGDVLDYLASLIGIEGKYDNDIDCLFAISEHAKGSPYYEFVCNTISASIPCNTFSDKPIHHLFCLSDKVLSFLSPTQRYSDILTQRILKIAIDADFDPKNLNLNKHRKLVSDAAIEATRTDEYRFEVARLQRDEMAREYIENSNKESYGGFPLYKDKSGAIVVVLECGLYAEIPADDAKNFDFQPAKPYSFSIVAYGTEIEPIIVKPVQ